MCNKSLNHQEISVPEFIVFRKPFMQLCGAAVTFSVISCWAVVLLFGKSCGTNAALRHDGSTCETTIDVCAPLLSLLTQLLREFDRWDQKLSPYTKTLRYKEDKNSACASVHTSAAQTGEPALTHQDLYANFLCSTSKASTEMHNTNKYSPSALTAVGLTRLINHR